MNFEDWLINQQRREDNIGFLARALMGQDAQTNSTKRKPDEHKYWVNIVTKIEGPGYVYYFNFAWQEYLRAKQAAENQTG
ncbi:MAG: hypothetical protein WAM60_11905 [Candidatus Promineifilaceae bacterium]